jgi:hypothetical protein
MLETKIKTHALNNFCHAFKKKTKKIQFLKLLSDKFFLAKIIGGGGTGGRCFFEKLCVTFKLVVIDNDALRSDE